MSCITNAITTATATATASAPMKTKAMCQRPKDAHSKNQTSTACTYIYMSFVRICVYLTFVLQSFPVTAMKAKLKLKYHSILQLHGA